MKKLILAITLPILVTSCKKSSSTSIEPEFTCHCIIEEWDWGYTKPLKTDVKITQTKVTDTTMCKDWDSWDSVSTIKRTIKYCNIQ